MLPVVLLGIAEQREPRSFLHKAGAVTIVYSFVVGIALLKLIDAFMKVRVGEHEERMGLDLTMHREAAYTVID